MNGGNSKRQDYIKSDWKTMNTNKYSMIYIQDGYDCMDQPESSSQIQEQNWIGSSESKFSDQTWIRSKSQDWVGNPEAKVQDQTWIGSSTPIPRASVLTDLQTTIDNKGFTNLEFKETVNIIFPEF